MAVVTLGGSTTGSNIDLSSGDQVFEVIDGVIDFTTDGGTTYFSWSAGERVVFSSGLTVGCKNNQPVSATFKHMPI